jgi:RNA polymerase sigma factor (sigma-70 family)
MRGYGGFTSYRNRPGPRTRRVTREPVPPLPDEEAEWIRAAQGGDRSAFARLVERYWDRLYRWLYHLTRDRHAAEHLTQETFLRALAAIKSFRPGSNFRAWVFRIGHNNFVNQKRAERGACSVRTRGRTVTEAEWLACDDPSQLLAHLASKAGERKLRMFAVACCRSVWAALTDERCQRAVEAVERHADAPLPTEDWERVREEARSGFGTAQTPQCKDANSPRTASCAAAMAAWHATIPDALEAAGRTGYQAANAARRAPGADFINAFAQACLAHADWLRDIFGNPFRSVAFSSEWHTDTVVSLARQQYESRDCSAMPILADALQDAGCDSTDILDHCRGSGSHVRGCWVVDLVLGKE